MHIKTDLHCKTENIAISRQAAELGFAVKIRPCRAAIENLLTANFDFLFQSRTATVFLVDTPKRLFLCPGIDSGYSHN